MRKELDLFANVRPVRIPQQGVDWTFFRENTEDLYAVGSQGLNATEDLAIDFRIITSQGSERIIDAAFAHAQRTGRQRVTIVTKANVVKTTDGKFLDIARKVAERYPDIEWDGWYIDIMTAALINPARQKDFQVLALPNLYGDILTDEAAQIQGGVGTAGSANVGKRYAMFEAIHGSAPRMVQEGQGPVRGPQLAAPRGRDDARAHRLRGPGRQAPQVAGHLRTVRAQGHHHRPKHRRDQPRVRPVHHVHCRRPNRRGQVAGIRQHRRLDQAATHVAAGLKPAR